MKLGNSCLAAGKMAKKGSVTVLLVFLFSALTTLTGAFISHARSLALEAEVEALGRLWASSVLGGYDRLLLERYGLFAYYGTPERVDAELAELASYSLSGSRYVRMEAPEASIFGYSIGSSEAFRRQMKETALPTVIQTVQGGNEWGAARPGAGAGDGASGYPAGPAQEMAEILSLTTRVSEREIVNERILSDLPSGGQGSYGSDPERFRYRYGVLGIVETGTDAFLECCYARSRFGTAVQPRADSFLRYEGEYLLCGRPSDRENFYGTQAAILAVRGLLNTAYLETDPAMQEKLLEVAELLAPGAGAPAMKEALTAAWALAESLNDYQLLLHGKKVPFRKDEASWAVRITAVINGTTGGYYDPGNEEGEEYGDYLFALLYLVGGETRLLRIMDLVEIDMKANCYRDFRLADYYTGLDFRIVVNGREHHFTDRYD